VCVRACARVCGSVGFGFFLRACACEDFFGFSFFVVSFCGNIFSSAVRQKAFLVLFEHKKYDCFLLGKIGAIKALI
jgi:hypothetical protein